MTKTRLKVNAILVDQTMTKQKGCMMTNGQLFPDVPNGWECECSLSLSLSLSVYIWNIFGNVKVGLVLNWSHSKLEQKATTCENNGRPLGVEQASNIAAILTDSLFKYDEPSTQVSLFKYNGLSSQVRSNSFYYAKFCHSLVEERQCQIYSNSKSRPIMTSFIFICPLFIW